MSQYDAKQLVFLEVSGCGKKAGQRRIGWAPQVKTSVKVNLDEKINVSLLIHMLEIETLLKRNGSYLLKSCITANPSTVPYAVLLYRVMSRLRNIPIIHVGIIGWQPRASSRTPLFTASLSSCSAYLDARMPSSFLLA